MGICRRSSRSNKSRAQLQTQNGTDTEATGTDISSWVSYEDGEVKFTLADAASYRSKGAVKQLRGLMLWIMGRKLMNSVL